MPLFFSFILMKITYQINLVIELITGNNPMTFQNICAFGKFSSNNLSAREINSDICS